jgi:aerobic-type carbon monoxide dehydrogenase small subunit (CoxS/CutS family)
LFFHDSPAGRRDEGSERTSINDWRRGMTISPEINQTTITIYVNGNPYELEVGQKPHQISPSHTLAHTLRETLGLVGTKIGCDQGACGSCTVLMDEAPVLSCMTLTVECHGKQITTIENLRDSRTGEPDPLQQAFIDHTAFQCGFCTPGIIMASKSLLDKEPSPDRQTVKKALAGHYCRCISHYHVVDAVVDAASKKSS